MAAAPPTDAAQATIAPRVVAVAASGGRDSTALLHATVRAAAALGITVVALHVHHGLNPNADHWLRHVQRQCAAWRRAGWPVHFLATRLQGQPSRGQSVEAWARAGRYAALSRMAAEQGASLLLLAHHRRDQAETVLLQALRGAGPAGLAAMPQQAQRGGLCWARPWLQQPAEAIQSYVVRHRLRHIDDDSNQDPRFDRNRLRHAVWPTLLAAFPQAEASLAASAREAHRAAELSLEVAQIDLATCKDAQGSLQVSPWQALSEARRWFVLRAWLQTRLPQGVPTALLQRLCAELVQARSARWPLTPTQELRLHRGVLCFQTVSPRPKGPAPAPLTLALDRPGEHALADWRGVLVVTAAEQGGLPCSLLRQAHLATRTGGEDFQRSAKGLARSLKKQYQAAGLAAWQRGGPLVFAQGQLIWVPGLGPDARAMAQPGQPQCQLFWRPDDMGG